jgi:periplasmic divalent cation tolerance protein
MRFQGEIFVMEGYHVVLITASGEEEAVGLARRLVGDALAACVNIVPRVRSIYRWQGEICDDGESLLIAKTTGERLERLIAVVQEAHSYETPEVIALPIVTGSEPYLRWLRESTEPQA